MYTQGQVIDFIEKAFGDAHLTNGGLNASVVCPRCAERQDNLQKRKLVVRTDDFLTHCWVCGYRSTNLLNLLEDYRPHLVDEYRERFKIQQPYEKCQVIDLDHLFDEKPETSEESLLVSVPVGFTLIANHLGQGNKSVENAWKYLQSRGFTKSDLWLWKLGVTDYKPAKKEEPNYRFRVIVPSFDAQGNLNYFSARTYWKDLKGPKYANPSVPRERLVFNELNINWNEELTVVEGVFDLMKCNENATCLLGSTLDASYLLFQRIVEHNTPVLLALDPDAKKKTFQIARLLLGYGISVRILHVPSDVEDVGKMTKEQFLEEAKKALPFTTKDLLQFKLHGT